MARLTEEMVIARSRQSDLSAIRKLNCWGAELGDVSVIKRMPNVEVLALSINKIRSLCEFADCQRLRELYVRKNDIRDLREIRHLRRLPALTSLWLDENPCTEHPEYRMTVLRNLPNLEKLDNVSVQPEEVAEAMRRGVYIPDSDDEGYPQQQQEAYGACRRRRSSDSSPERDEQTYRHAHREQLGSDSSESAPEPRPEQQAWASPPPRRPDDDPPPAMTRSHYEPRCVRSPDDAALRHSLSAQSVKEYSYGNGALSPHHECLERHDRCESYAASVGRCEAGAGGAGGGGPGGAGGPGWEREAAPREYPSAVMGEHRGFTRRPVTRNSNLLSAVLCLLKELDYPSLEVAEMAVRCRMDELANQ